MTKMTYVDALNSAIASMTDAAVVEKLTSLRDSIVKKNSAERKPTATQTANEGFKSEIKAAMVEGTQYTITELMKLVPALVDISNQRVSAIVRQMVEDGSVVRTEEKRKAYFSLAVEG